MKIGIIGTGKMGRNHARIYSEMRGIDEIYIYDVNTESSSKVANEFRISFCKSLEELISKVDAVSICVPTKYHFEIASKVINAGKHCLIEKPITLNTEDGKKLIELSKNKSITIGVGHIERFNPIIPEIKKIISNPKYIEIKRHNPDSGRITDADIISDLMIHDIDIVFNYLFKNNNFEISGALGVKNDLFDLVSALFKCNSTVVSLSSSRLSSNKIRSIVVEEEDKTIVGDYMSQEIYIYRKPEKNIIQNADYRQENLIEKVMVSKVEPLRLELSNFINSIKNKEKFPISLEDAVNALEIAELIRTKVNK
ncbi:MAG: Gfo/Idh/MocA family oxidoreductase [Candidatus ainarchaeum sp.]|nr:Gfo/Idh/MocA family oxidoreductase [Candidatus ainarchaeum sp.]